MEKIWENLVAAARAVQNPRQLTAFIEAGGVAAALLSAGGYIYTGVCIDTACSLGMCAERSAIAAMITHGEQHIQKLVALMPDGRPGLPCGACREMLYQLSGGDVEILLDTEAGKTVRLEALLPAWWGAERAAEN